MTVTKTFSRVKLFKGITAEHILGIIGLIFVIMVLYRYSSTKNLTHSPMTNIDRLNYSEIAGQSSEISNQSPQSTYAPYNGASNANVASSADSANAMNQMAASKPVANPSDLLPINNNNQWGSSIPQPDADLKNINLMNPSQLVGINTQGSSLRNANLQLRSEPANPRSNTNCPWNISTIETDQFRKPLEIGASA